MTEPRPALSDDEVREILERAEKAPRHLNWTVPGYDEARASRQRLIQVAIELSVDMKLQVLAQTMGDLPFAEYLAAAGSMAPALAHALLDTRKVLRELVEALRSSAMQGSETKDEQQLCRPIFVWATWSHVPFFDEEPEQNLYAALTAAQDLLREAQP